MALIDRLQAASFKGVDFLVQSSSIKFGQKTVTHQYPNTDRTEVEFLGLAEDTFNLDIFIHSAEPDYIEKRNALKIALSDGEVGQLVHPYEGQIEVSVVGQVTLREVDEEFGVARFTVTFQKTTEQSFPAQAIDNSSVIRQLFGEFSLQLQEFVEDNFAFLGDYPGVFEDAENELNQLLDIFNEVQNLVPLKSNLSALFLSNVRTFDNTIPQMINDPVLLAQTLADTFESLDGIAVADLENVIVYQSFFDFGDDNPIDTPITVEGRRIQENREILRTYVQSIALALSYNAISLVDFDDDIQMNSFESSFEDQYQKILAFVRDADIRKDLSLLRNEAVLFFDNQDVRRVFTENIAPMPLVKLVYLLYESFDDFDRLFELNGKRNPVLYQGDTRVLTIE